MKPTSMHRDAGGQVPAVTAADIDLQLPRRIVTPIGALEGEALLVDHGLNIFNAKRVSQRVLPVTDCDELRQVSAKIGHDRRSVERRRSEQATWAEMATMLSDLMLDDGQLNMRLAKTNLYGQYTTRHAAIEKGTAERRVTHINLSFHGCTCADWEPTTTQLTCGQHSNTWATKTELRISWVYAFSCQRAIGNNNKRPAPRAHPNAGQEKRRMAVTQGSSSLSMRFLRCFRSG